MTQDKQSGTMTSIYHATLAGSALIYASGFIVVYTFLERWGIRETGDQLLRVKYFHVGFLCLLFPLLWVIPMFATGTLLKARRRGRKFKWNRLSVWLMPILSLALCTPLCFLPIFAHADYIRHHGWETSALVLFSLIGLVSAADPIQQVGQLSTLVGVTSTGQEPSRGMQIARATIATLALGPATYLFWKLGVDLYPELHETFRTSYTAPSAWLYLLFNALIAFYYRRGRKRLQQIQSEQPSPDTESDATNVRVVTACRIAGFYFLGVLSFSYGWYPFIPAARGGGSLLEVPNATINVRLNSPESAYSGLFDESKTTLEPNSHSVHAETVPVAVVEVTSGSLYVSRAEDSGGPACWSEGRLPHVYELPRSTVESIEYSPVTSLQSEMPTGRNISFLRGAWKSVFGAPHAFEHVCMPDNADGTPSITPAKVLIGPALLPTQPERSDSKRQ
jgi:hypothetical protein